MKFQLGLFDQPCVSDPSKPCVDASAANAAVTAGRDQTLKAAQESITLLRNNGNALPLSPTSKVVVTGPSADSMTNQLGGWSVSWQGVFGAGHVCCMGPANQIPPGTTVLKGIQASDPAAVYAPDQAAALAAAGTHDAYVVAVGEKAYAEGLGDNPAPALPADQQALITALEATGKPVIVVVIAGRPVGLGPAENANAVLMAYQGSTEAGQAVADVVFGKTNPSGKLPVSWPSDAATVGGDFDGTAPSPLGDQPKFFDQLPGTGSGPGHAYNPLYPFGFGLSYTTFQTTNLSVTPTVSRHGNATVTFTVSNTGSRAGTDIVPVYVAQPVSGVVVPPQRLVGFTRVTLDAGESKVVHVSFPASALAESARETSTRRDRPPSSRAATSCSSTRTTPRRTTSMCPHRSPSRRHNRCGQTCRSAQFRKRNARCRRRGNGRCELSFPTIAGLNWSGGAHGLVGEQSEAVADDADIDESHRLLVAGLAEEALAGPENERVGHQP